MRKELRKKLNHYQKEHSLRNKKRLALSTLSLIVVVSTALALMLPAITMETICGLETHQHGPECYSTAEVPRKTETLCVFETSDPIVLHSHDEYCYDADGTLVCPLPEIEEHLHTDDCFTEVQRTVCNLEESPGHVHGPSCYSERALICTQEELAAHKHLENCYENPRISVCGLQEDGSHKHTEACFENPRTPTCGQQHEHIETCFENPRNAICDLMEGPGHSHTDACLTEAKLICELSEGDGAHKHNDSCFESELVQICEKEVVILHTHTEECMDGSCGMQEVIAHQHTADCIRETEGFTEQVLICQLPEHSHTPECYPDKGTTCGIKAHTHGESCFDENSNLSCEKQEHEHSDECMEAAAEDSDLDDTETAGLHCGMEAHVHSEFCFGENDELICEQPEHEHTDTCRRSDAEEQDELPPEVIPGENENYVIDPYARSESAEYIEDALSHVVLTGDWAKDVLSIAKSQLGYRESTTDYAINEEGRKKGYTYYGDWYGIPYGDWCAMFVSFCLDTAGVREYPLSAGCQTWIEKLLAEDVDMWRPACDPATGERYIPEPGDLIFYDFDLDGLADHIGLVYELFEATTNDPALIKTIEGNYSDMVCIVTHAQEYEGIMGYGILPENPDNIFELQCQLENGVLVTLSGHKDALPYSPDEVHLMVRIVTDDSSIDQINGFLEDNGYEYLSSLSVDISLWHDDEEIQPAGPLMLTFAGVNDDVDDIGFPQIYVFHIDSESGRLQDMNAQLTEQGDVSVETDHFSVYEVVLAKEAGEISVRGVGDSGTISTVDSRADGITLNLFDYYGLNLDTWNNKVTSPIYNGINAGKTMNDLLFLGSGDEASGNGINEYTYGSTALQGIVNPTLTNGYPTLRTNNSSLAYLFNLTPNGNTKRVFADVNHLFQKDADGYYHYSSEENYAYYGSNAGGGNFTVYSDTYTNADGTSIGFFPFNDYDTRYRNVKPNNIGEQATHYNHHFGMTMSASFWIPEDGKVNGKDMIFDFSGDDDVWVFIDGVLVLDIGGIHEAVHGQINFATGAVTVSSAVPASGTSGITIGTSSSLEAIFAAAGRTYDESDYSEHTISFFYLERGGCYSDCSLTFNLSVFQHRDLEIEKEIEGNDPGDMMETEFQFRLYMGNGSDSENYSVYTGPAHYSDGTPVVFSPDGTFTLKAGQRIIVPDIPDYKNYYIKELAISNELFPEVKINGQTCQPIYSTVNEDLYEIESETENIKDSVEVICTNVLPKPPKITVEKLWRDSGGNPLEPPLESISIELWRKYLSPQTVPSHTVQFQVLTYNASTQQTSPYLLTSVDVADGGSISFASAVWTAASGATSSGGVVQQNGTYAFTSWLSAPVYIRSNITQDEIVTILFNVNGSGGWLYDNQTSSVRFHIVDYDEPQPADPSAGSYVHEIVDTVTLNDGNNWSYQWLESQLPATHSSGAPYYYYVKELTVEGFEVTYSGNDGITEGEITITNTAQTVNLTIQKTVVGGSLTDEFDFELLFKDENDQIITTIPEGAGYTIGIDGKIVFTLTHNESITISGIPVGSIATIREISHDGYTVLIKDGNQTLFTGDSGVISLNGHQTITVVNNAGTVLPETGGTGTLPYTLCGAIIMLAAVMYGYGWRKRERRSAG